MEQEEFGCPVVTAPCNAGDTYVTPGLSVHRELVELASAGMPRADVLRAATLDAADFMGVSDQYGSVETGKAADLILLEDNPLRDIRATERIHTLFFAGRSYDRAQLDALLEHARQYANSLRLNLRLAWSAVSSPLIRAQLAD